MLAKYPRLSPTEHQDLAQQEQEASRSSATFALDTVDKDNDNIHSGDVPQIFWSTHNVDKNLCISALCSLFVFPNPTTGNV